MRQPICALTRSGFERSLPGVEVHSRSCLRCQAEGARRRRLVRELGRLRHVVEVAPPSLLPEIERRIATSHARDSSKDEAGLLSRLTAAGAFVATAAAAVVLWRRSHAPA